MPNLTDPIFSNEDAARAHFEAIRWPNGPYCPHCGNADEDEIVKLTSKAHRAGLYQCRECREQFTVTVGSVMERSHIPLHKWALGFYLMAASKKGVSAHKLMRTLGIGSYRTAWFLAHRIREAMIEDTGDTGPFGGPGKIVEADETYHGTRETPRKRKPVQPRPTKSHKSGGAQKRVIVGLVERGGRVRTFHVRALPVTAFGKFWLRTYRASQSCIPMKARSTLRLEKSLRAMPRSFTQRMNMSVETYTQTRLKTSGQFSSAA